MDRVIGLLDAMPYLRAYSGQTFVVKVGGELLANARWRDGIATELAVLHRLGIKVVAEGIETAEQRRLLEQIGCEYGQGFLFSRPLTGEALEEILAAGRSAAGPDS